jgi:hypothetical protein
MSVRGRVFCWVTSLPPNKRHDLLNNVVTYNSERPYGGNWSFDNNGYHGWRGTRTYRSKSASMSYPISQATNYTCFG